MERKEQLLKLLENNPNKDILEPLVDDMVFLEIQLAELKKLPFIKVHPQRPELQKATSAGKQYKELLQQYNNCLKILIHSAGGENVEADSPLRVWVKSQLEKMEKDV